MKVRRAAAALLVGPAVFLVPLPAFPQAAYVLPAMEAPLRIRSLFLPPVAPSPLAQISAGWTGVSGDAAPVLDAQGWETSRGVRATLFLGVRLFSGLARVGAARALTEGGRWRLELGVGG